MNDLGEMGKNLIGGGWKIRISGGGVITGLELRLEIKLVGKN